MTKEEFLNGERFEYGILPHFFQKDKEPIEGYLGDIIYYDPTSGSNKYLCAVYSVDNAKATIATRVLGSVCTGTLRIDKLKKVAS